MRERGGRMASVLSDITRLSLELLEIDKQKTALYAREKDVKEQLKKAQELLLEKCRNGQTIEGLEIEEE